MVRSEWGKPGRSLRRWRRGCEIEESQEEYVKPKSKCHWCGAPLPERNYDVVLYAHISATGQLPPVEVPVCVPCLKQHHKNKATRMEKV